MPSVVVWEGEWPQLKRAVTSARQCAQSTVAAGSAALRHETFASARRLATSFDETVTSQSRAFSRYCFENRWVGPAAAVTTAATFVASRSFYYWGVRAALRNGVLTSAMGASYMFPEEIQACILSMSWPWSNMVTSD
jgi:hypothetical protein